MGEFLLGQHRVEIALVALVCETPRDSIYPERHVRHPLPGQDRTAKLLVGEVDQEARNRFLLGPH